MIWVLIVGFSVVLTFGFVLMYGAPYLPTKREQIDQALKLLDLQKGQLLYELGAGTGGLTIAAAQKGIRVRAVELNPLVFIVLWVRTRRYRDHVEVKLANFWSVDVSDADGVYVFLIERFMPRLEDVFTEQMKPKAKLASYAFELPSRKSAKKLGPMYLYVR